MWRWWSLLRRYPIESRVPWLPFRVIERLERELTPTSRVFEYGGGGSTLWFADHCGEVVTVEHDDDWYRLLAERTASLEHVTIFHRGATDGYAEYVPAIQGYPDDHFDVVVVDGRERVRCFAASLTKVRPGGLVVLDDTNRDRYHDAFELASGWSHRTRGLTTAKSEDGVTTVWLRPTV